jgi:flagellar protein FliS
MAKPNAVADQYLRTQVESSTPVELVVLLYDAALRFTAAARDAMARRDIPARRTALSKAMRIVAELQQSLDVDRGGTVAKDLDALYTWVMARLVKATTDQQVQPIEEARRVLSTLATAWRSLAGRQPTEAEP